MRIRIPDYSREWRPLTTHSTFLRPEPGQHIAHKHAVWNVIDVQDEPLTDDERDAWLKVGMPDLNTWPRRPYRVTVEWVGGVKPDHVEREDGSKRNGSVRIPAGVWMTWHVYPGVRWPQCSCCGEPMPCRAEMADQQVAAGLNKIEELEAIPPGACWACHEPITTRQKSVTYPGDNIDLPGGQQPYFHTRQDCHGSARAYEERWLAIDPRRERILTWPECNGALIVHADGTSECIPWNGAAGQNGQPQPDCQGHTTHDHGYQRACYVGDSCTRGCDPETGHGIRLAPRPERRQSSTGGLF